MITISPKSSYFDLFLCPVKKKISSQECPIE